MTAFLTKYYTVEKWIINLLAHFALHLANISLTFDASITIGTVSNYFSNISNEESTALVDAWGALLLLLLLLKGVVRAHCT